MTWKYSVRHQIEQMKTSPHKEGPCYQPVKTAPNLNPLLIIGLGGTGLQIAHETRKQLIKYFTPSQRPFPGTTKELPGHTRVMAIDTDRNLLDYWGFSGAERCDISDDQPTLSSRLRLDNRGMLPTYISEWLNPDLSSPFLGHGMEGAMGIRQVGRLALFCHLYQVMDSIRLALQQLAAGHNNSIFVVLAAGSTGGTGSAIFLDVACLVRHIAQELRIHVYIAGVLTMPEVHAFREFHLTDLLMANGYAFLKELDYWMDRADLNQCYEQQYAPQITARCQDRLLDDCYLLGDPSIYPFTSDLLTHLCRTAADCIVSLYAYDQHNTGVPGPSSSYFSWRANVRGILATVPKQFDVCNRYTTIGICSARMPLDELLMAEGAFLFGEAGKACGAEHTPDLFSETPYLSFVQQIVLNRVDELMDSVQVNMPADAGLPLLLASNHFAPHSLALSHELQVFFHALEEKANGREGHTHIDICTELMEERLASMFADPAQGPFYASRFLGATPAENDFNGVLPHRFHLIGILEQLRAGALAKREHVKAAQQQATANAEKCYETIKVFLFPAIPKPKIAKQYFCICLAVQQAIREYWKQELLYRIYDALLAKANEILTQVFQPLCYTLMELSTACREMAAQASGAPVSRDSMDAVDRNLLLQCLQTHEMTPQRTEELLSDLYSDMIHSHNGRIAGRWIIWNHYSRTATGVAVCDGVQRVLNDLFRQFNSQTLSQLWMLQYPSAITVTGTLNYPSIAGILLPEMSSRTVPMFWTNPVYAGAHTATSTSEYITVPHNTAGLVPAMNASPLRAVHATDLPDRIFMIRATDGVCLHHYDGLQTCEQHYLQLVLSGTHRGCHLWENRKHWKDLPDPLPRAARSPDWHNPVRKAADDALLARISALKQQGRIELDATGAGLLLRFNSALTHDMARQLLADLNAKVLPVDAAQKFWPQVLDTCRTERLFLQPSVLDHYRIRYWGQDPTPLLAEDMLMRRPATIAALEKEAAELAELYSVIREYPA